MRFYLGTHEVSWLGRASFPLFVSHRRLSSRVHLPAARCEWALDSGGFTELNLFGGWRTTPAEYLEGIHRYTTEVGRLAWAAPMDWMCEPVVVARTGLSVREHQERTVASVVELRAARPATNVIPVLQGWQLSDYHDCIRIYENAGIDLRNEPVVGLGSVCRRQRTVEIDSVVTSLAALGLRLHGFGVKAGGLSRYGPLLASADSLAWSYNARRSEPLAGCAHKACSNCLRWATKWREQVVAGLPDSVQLALPIDWQRRLDRLATRPTSRRALAR